MGVIRFVLPLAQDKVVDLAQRGLARELHLAGIDLSRGDNLELLDRDVYVAQVDRHCFSLRFALSSLLLYLFFNR